MQDMRGIGGGEEYDPKILHDTKISDKILQKEVCIG